ncbi:Uncharacterised protein [Yersinia pseudotuberculosis]|nr:Uncharacterised protein [Yersinia pseudotuberculosis]CQD58385.1 Uncharacterised protein [Yersinia intermedia]CND14713.1 Uncharacterised protein [Yersinia pseudotuberculosis]CNE61128.1 Uncharacterised protein [Yersinia pseudotuberculosis]CNI27597.1 Uncharacterised protein [Yersinia pseudotuberculosis]
MNAELPSADEWIERAAEPFWLPDNVPERSICIAASAPLRLLMLIPLPIELLD